MGITERYRKMGIGALLYAKVFEMTRRKNITWAEASYVMANNAVMNHNIKSIGGEVYKKYRIYELAFIQPEYRQNYPTEKMCQFV